MTQPPDDAALVVQNRAFRTLNTLLQEEIADHRGKAQEYHAAIQTLDSEREANAILTTALEAKDRRIAELEGMLSTRSPERASQAARIENGRWHVIQPLSRDALEPSDKGVG